MFEFWDFIEICSWWCNQQYTSIGLDNGLAPNWRQAIMWTYDGIDHWRMYTSLGFNELREFNWKLLRNVDFLPLVYLCIVLLWLIRLDGTFGMLSDTTSHRTALIATAENIWNIFNTVNTVPDDVIKWKLFPRYWPFVPEFTDYGWIPLKKSSGAELWSLLWSAPEPTVEQTMETPVKLDSIIVSIIEYDSYSLLDGIF